METIPNIKLTRTPKSKTFNQLLLGEMFVFNNQLYIKTDINNDDLTMKNRAICLKSRFVVDLADNTNVEIPTEITIDIKY